MSTDRSFYFARLYGGKVVASGREMNATSHVRVVRGVAFSVQISRPAFLLVE